MSDLSNVVNWEYDCGTALLLDEDGETVDTLNLDDLVEDWLYLHG